MAVPISVTNPDLLRHSTELFMDSGFAPLCQRMGAMVAFRRFEDFTRYPEWPCLPDSSSRGPSKLLLPPPVCVCGLPVTLRANAVRPRRDTLGKLFNLSAP